MSARMLSRTGAGMLLGFGLACALGGLYAVLGPQAPADDLIVALIAMVPLWIASWSYAYAARDAKRAWLWLSALNLIAYVGLWTAKTWAGWPA